MIAYLQRYDLLNQQVVKIFFQQTTTYSTKENPSVDWFLIFSRRCPRDEVAKKPRLKRRQDWYAGSMAPGFSLPQHLGMKEKWQVGIMDQWTCVDVVWQV